jgi:hypothetical protein
VNDCAAIIPVEIVQSADDDIGGLVFMEEGDQA